VATDGLARVVVIFQFPILVLVLVLVCVVDKGHHPHKGLSVEGVDHTWTGTDSLALGTTSSLLMVA
jgi:hypothetical protein